MAKCALFDATSLSPVRAGECQAKVSAAKTATPGLHRS